MKNFRQKYGFFCRIAARSINIVFIISMLMPVPVNYAQSPAITGASVFSLPPPGTMIPMSAPFNPPIVKGISIYPDNPFKFDFIIDPGDDKLQGEDLKSEANKLIKYFMAALTVPEDEMWVNLSPYEKDRIIAHGLNQTELGRDLLAQDYILKQLTASLMYPEDELGSEFWQRVYAKVQERYGTTEVPMNTFNKVWIVPEKANVYVNGNSVFVTDNHLKVMLEEDYLALENNIDRNNHGVGEIPADQMNEISEVSKEVIREVIIPEIEKEVNQGKNFASLRQIFNSMILAVWYKQNLKESALTHNYANQNKTAGIDLNDPQMKEKIYNQYVQAFKQGVYNYIREDYNARTQQIIPRKYFSGGIEGPKKVTDRARGVGEINDGLVQIIAEFRRASESPTGGSSPIDRNQIKREIAEILSTMAIVSEMYGGKEKSGLIKIFNFMEDIVMLQDSVEDSISMGYYALRLARKFLEKQKEEGLLFPAGKVDILTFLSSLHSDYFNTYIQQKYNLDFNAGEWDRDIIDEDKRKENSLISSIVDQNIEGKQEMIGYVALFEDGLIKFLENVAGYHSHLMSTEKQGYVREIYDKLQGILKGLPKSQLFGTEEGSFDLEKLFAKLRISIHLSNEKSMVVNATEAIIGAIQGYLAEDKFIGKGEDIRKELADEYMSYQKYLQEYPGGPVKTSEEVKNNVIRVLVRVFADSFEYPGNLGKNIQRILDTLRAVVVLQDSIDDLIGTGHYAFRLVEEYLTAQVASGKLDPTEKKGIITGLRTKEDEYFHLYFGALSQEGSGVDYKKQTMNFVPKNIAPQKLLKNLMTSADDEQIKREDFIIGFMRDFNKDIHKFVKKPDNHEKRSRQEQRSRFSEVEEVEKAVDKLFLLSSMPDSTKKKKNGDRGFADLNKIFSEFEIKARFVNHSSGALPLARLLIQRISEYLKGPGFGHANDNFILNLEEKLKEIEKGFTKKVLNLRVVRHDSGDEKGPGSSSPLNSNKTQITKDIGGIDLNPENLDLKTHGQKIDFDVPRGAQNFAPLQGLDALPINGLTPVIIQIAPIINIKLLLGTAGNDDFLQSTQKIGRSALLEREG